MARKHTHETREAIRQRSLAQGQARGDAVVDSIQEAMRQMATEILGNDGIYPENKGRVSLNEVCRRAKVHNTTLFKDKYAKTKQAIGTWIDDLKQSAATTVTAARKTAATRAADWKELYEALEAQHLLVSDQLIEERRLRLIADERISDLEAQLSKVNRATVVSLRSIPSRSGD